MPIPDICAGDFTRGRNSEYNAGSRMLASCQGWKAWTTRLLAEFAPTDAYSGGWIDGTLALRSYLGLQTLRFWGPVPCMSGRRLLSGPIQPPLAAKSERMFFIIAICGEGLAHPGVV